MGTKPIFDDCMRVEEAALVLYKALADLEGSITGYEEKFLWMKAMRKALRAEACAREALDVINEIESLKGGSGNASSE